MIIYTSPAHAAIPVSYSRPLTFWYPVKDRIPEERRYEMKDKNYTLFRSDVLCWRGMYLAVVERRLRW